MSGIRRNHNSAQVWRWGPAVLLWALPGCATVSPVSTEPPEFHQGVVAYNQEDYAQAEILFNRVIESHMGSSILPQAQWMLARSLEAQSRFERALTQYRLFVHNYPNHEYRLKAQEKIEHLEGKLYPWKKNRVIHLAVLVSLSDLVTTGSLESWLSRLEEAGVDTVVVKVFQNGSGQRPSGVFFQTQHAPVLADRLTTLIQAARRHPFRIFAWMSVRQMNWKLRSDPAWADLQYDRRGRTLVPSGSLDLLQPAVQDYIQKVYKDLTIYPLDGIVFGDDLFYKTAEGLSAEAQKKFVSDFGVPLPENALDEVLRVDLTNGREQIGLPPAEHETFWRWVGWKSRQVYPFLSDLQNMLRQKHPVLQFGILFSEEAVLDPLEALIKTSQDLLEAKRHQFDFYIINLELSPEPMSQNRSPRQDTKRMSRLATESLRLIGRPEGILVRIRVKGLTGPQIRQALDPETHVDPSVLVRLTNDFLFSPFLPVQP